MGAYMRRHRRLLVLQALLTAISISFLALRVDIDEAIEQLTEVRLLWALPGLFAFTLSKAIHAYRWRVLLWHRRELHAGDLLSVFLVSNLANAVVPLRAGDVLRVELTRRRFGIPRPELTSSVFLVESVLDGVAFVALLLPALLLLNPSALRTPMAALIGAGVLGIFAASLLVARMEVASNVERWRLLRPLPAPARARIAAVIPSFVNGMRVLRSGRPVTIAVALSIVAWMAEVSVYWMMGRAFGLELGLSEAVLVMIAANVIVSLPLTPWDVGPYEVAVTEAMALMGFGLSQAGAFAVGSHILLVIWISITGLLAMWTLQVSPRELIPQATPAGDEEASEEQLTAADQTRQPGR
jgi:glycosyltransferase 2 family protein